MADLKSSTTQRSILRVVLLKFTILNTSRLSAAKGSAYCIVNLLQSLFRSAVQFEFHYINVLVGLQHKIYPALRSVIFRFHINPTSLKTMKSTF